MGSTLRKAVGRLPLVRHARLIGRETRRAQRAAARPARPESVAVRDRSCASDARVAHRPTRRPAAAVAQRCHGPADRATGGAVVRRRQGTQGCSQDTHQHGAHTPG